MTHSFYYKEPAYKVWFKKEQGNYLKSARLRAGLSVQEVARRTGVDIRWVECGEVSLQVRNLIYLVRLYRIPLDHFRAWERYVGFKIRLMRSEYSQTVALTENCAELAQLH